MKTSLALTLPLLALPCLADLFPNGDFENGNTSWVEASGNGTYSFSYPETGGNEGGYAIIDHTANDGGFGLIVGDGGQIISLSSLGLEAGETYVFSQDMILLSGPKIGGMKVEFYTGDGAVEGQASTGDLFPDAINGGSEWATYDFPVAIPAAADGIKIVSLWGEGSSVGFDNVQFDPTSLDVAIPNADFSLGSFAWDPIGSPETSWSYPATGGNPDAYGVMTNTGGGFGIWVANDNQIIPLSNLDLSPGDTAIFQQDMIILSGENVGGLKIDFFSGGGLVGDSGEIDPEVIGDGTTWETYSFPVVIPSGVDGVKIVPLEGQGSSVGYDNFTVSVLPPPIEANSTGSYVEGTIVSWNPTSPDKIHQPQRSLDGVTWNNFGPGYLGIETTSLLDPNPAPFYRIAETDAAGLDSLINGDFEIADFIDPNCAESWICFSPSGQEPIRTTLDAFSGDASIRLAVANGDSATPNQAEIQQNLGNVGGFVIGGQTYTFSFWAKQISSGPTYVQNYKLQWFDGAGTPVGAAIGFKPFAGGDNTWAQIVEPNIVAPPAAAGVFIQIFGATGALAGDDIQGEVFIDAISLTQSAGGETTFLDVTEAPGAGIYVKTRSGQLYQAQVSSDLQNFENLSGVFEGNGSPVGAGTSVEGDERFYRLLELPLGGE